MISEPKLKLVEDFLAGFSKEELIWLNGYVNGFVANNVKQSNHNGHANKKITIAFATETGNSKKLATELTTLAKQKGVITKLTSLDQYKLNDLEKEEYFFLIISTQGEGEPPATAKKFYDYIHNVDHSLSQLNFSVLALGDSSYPLFCKAGEDVDQQFQKLGAKRIIPLQKCDVDYNEDAKRWFEQILKTVEGKSSEARIVSKTNEKSNHRKFYLGKIVTNINLNDRGSNKETYHIEMATDETPDYKPGDSLAIIPKNKKEIVDTIINITGVDESEIVQTKKHSSSIRELLTKHLNICYLLNSTIQKYAALTEHAIPEVRMDLLDLLRIFPLKNKEQFIEVIQLLHPISPRLYSISSSPSAHSNEVHITVGKNSFLFKNEKRFGLCSEFLGDLKPETEIQFYIHHNRAFGLPAPNKDIIMIGPGTGIAAFRSFLAERDAAGASGKNWLFFGEQHFVTDFLYQTELRNYLNTGVLTKINLAFSRDQEERIYVQHRIEEEKEMFAQWLNEGAFLYISGSKTMAADVEQTILKIIGEEGFEKLKSEERYQKDIY